MATQVATHTGYVKGMTGQVSRANEGFDSNAAFVVTDDGVVVFDALGSPPLGGALVAAIRTVTDQPMRRVIVSHFHADHCYGLQSLQAAGAEVWAYTAARDYLAADAPRLRLAERRQSLAPWGDQDTRIVTPDLWLDSDVACETGGLHFTVVHVGPAHTAEDLALVVAEDEATLVGDLMFAGRIPFVGETDSKARLAAIDKLGRSRPKVMVGGHGPASFDAATDVALTRDYLLYLLYLRQTMGAAAEAMIGFDEAYAHTDRSRFAHLPAFDGAHRRASRRMPGSRHEAPAARHRPRPAHAADDRIGARFPARRRPGRCRVLGREGQSGRQECR